MSRARVAQLPDGALRKLYPVLVAVTLWSAWMFTNVPRLSGQTRTNPQATALKEFVDEVEEYVKLHNRLEDELPKLGQKEDATKIKAHQEALALKIQIARKGAKQGDIFESDVRVVLRQLIQRALLGPGGEEALRAINEENPSVLPLKVNAIYPSSLPVTTMPPTVLLSLPKLPEEVEFRFVGRNLILRDTHANLIIDFIVKAIR